MNYISDNISKLKQSIYPYIPFLTPSIKGDTCQTDPEINKSRYTIIACMTPIAFTAGAIFFTSGQQRWFDFIGKVRSFTPIQVFCCKIAMINVTSFIFLGYFNEISSWLSGRVSRYDQELSNKKIDQLAIKKVISGQAQDDASKWLENRPSAIEMLGEKVHSQGIQMLFFLNNMKETLPPDCKRYIIANYLAFLKSKVKVTDEKILGIFNTQL